MKKSRFSEEQIIGPKESEAGIKTADLARKHGISRVRFNRWKAKFGGMDVSEARRQKDEDRRLMHLADLTLDNQMLRAVVGKW